jgi:hypothetical protein
MQQAHEALEKSLESLTPDQLMRVSKTTNIPSPDLQERGVCLDFLRDSSDTPSHLTSVSRHYA